MNNEEWGIIVNKVEGMSDDNQGKISHMIMNWDTLYGSDLSEQSKSVISFNMEKSSHDWKIDIYDHWKSIPESYGYGLHRKLLRPEDILSALKIIKETNNKNYKLPNKRVISIHLKTDKEMYHETTLHIKDKDGLFMEYPAFIKSCDKNVLDGMDTKQRGRYYLAQFKDISWNI